MQNIIIVGAGSFGRELCCWLEDIVAGKPMRIGGFLDDTRAPAEALNAQYPYPLLGAIDSYAVRQDDVFVIAIADPPAKLRIAAALLEKGATFLTVVHPTAVLARTARLGQGVIVCPFALVSADSSVGDFVTINSYSSIGHDAQVAQGCTLSCHVDITGHTQIDEGVFFGSGATVLPKVQVGAQARIGAGTVIMRKVAPGSTMYAMPAKKL